MIPDLSPSKARRIARSTAGAHSAKDELEAIGNAALPIAEEAKSNLSDLAKQLKEGALQDAGRWQFRLRCPGVTRALLAKDAEAVKLLQGLEPALGIEPRTC